MVRSSTRNSPPALARPRQNIVDGVDQFAAPAVVERHVEPQAGAGGGLDDREIEVVLHFLGQFLDPADHLEADVVFLQVGQFLAQVVPQQGPQGLNLVTGPLPVLHRESVEGEGVDAQPAAGLDDLANRAHAGPVAGDPRQVPAFGPAAVAVHDNGNVARQTRSVDPGR